MDGVGVEGGIGATVSAMLDARFDPPCDDSTAANAPQVRPWLRRDTPLLWRSADTVQVGEGDRRVVIGHLSRDLLAWVRSLTGDRTEDEALRACPDPTTGRRLLAALRLAGALDDAARVPRITRPMTQAQRDRLHRQQAAARLTYSDERHHLAAEARAQARVAIHGRGPLADAVRIALRHSGIGRVTMAAPPSSSARIGRAASSTTDLVILAHMWHPDSFDDAGCLALDLPHLPIAAWGPHGVVGPLVIPGRTACLRCAQLYARDRDQAFPTLQMQRNHARPDPPPVDAALALAVAAMTTVTVTGWVESLAGAAPTGRRMHIRLPGGVVDYEDLQRHPLCGCGWAQPTGVHALSG